MKRTLPIFLILLLLISGCGSPGAETEPAATVGGSGNSAAAKEMFTDRDLRGDYSGGVAIALNGDSASCDASGVTVNGSTVTIHKEGVYLLSGTLNDGMIVVNVSKKEKVQLVLAGAAIHSETSAALYVLQADKVF